MPDPPAPAPSGLTETRLLLDALRPGITAGRWIASLKDAGADPDRLAVRSIVLGLAPVLHLRLAEIGCALPERAAAKLHAVRESHRRRNLSILAQLGEILDALRDRGIRPIALKGIHLATTAYPDIGSRPMNDIDLLVEQAELGVVAAVLEELGYARRETSPERGAGVTKHTSTFRRPGSGGANPNPYLLTSGDRTVEPHSSLEESWYGLVVDITPGVRRRAVESDLAGRGCRMLVTEDLVLHLAVHLTFHLIMGQSAMVQLVDLWQVARTLDVDWPVVARRAGERRAAPFVLAALGLARRATGAPIPEDALEALRRISPPAALRRANAIDLAYVLRRTLQRPRNSLRSRLLHGLANRAETARWARDHRDRWRTWRTAALWWRSDTARDVLGGGPSR